MPNMTVIRKMSGRVVDRNVSDDMLKVVLSCQPFGVYDIEDNEGNPVYRATVKRNALKLEKV
jgi:hypothetical protein